LPPDPIRWRKLLKKGLFIFFFILGYPAFYASAMPLGQDVVEPGASDRLGISLYRYEKSNAWWVNLGLPMDFFAPVLKLSENSGIYSIKGLEYGLGVSAWPLKCLQARLSLPFESNTFVDSTSVNQSSVRPGDLKVGVSWLGLGERTSSIRVAADGWVVFPTGTSPFTASYPILASGLGVYRAAVGTWASERLGRFSFFQWIDYEKSSSASFTHFYGLPDANYRLDWPDRLYAGVRVEWCIFRRGEREASLLGEMRVQHWDDWKVNGYLWSPADRIFDSGLGLRVRADKDLTVEGRWSYSPVEWSYSHSRADFGDIITLVLCFHPFENGPAR
jgi:hypothetical protein